MCCIIFGTAADDMQIDVSCFRIYVYAYTDYAEHFEHVEHSKITSPTWKYPHACALNFRTLYNVCLLAQVILEMQIMCEQNKTRDGFWDS